MIRLKMEVYRDDRVVGEADVKVHANVLEGAPPRDHKAAREADLAAAMRGGAPRGLPLPGADA